MRLIIDHFCKGLTLLKSALKSPNEPILGLILAIFVKSVKSAKLVKMTYFALNRAKMALFRPIWAVFP